MMTALVNANNWGHKSHEHIYIYLKINLILIHFIVSLIILMIIDRILINFNYDGYYLPDKQKMMKKYHLISILHMYQFFFLKIIILINFVIVNDLSICELSLLMTI